MREIKVKSSTIIRIPFSYTTYIYEIYRLDGSINHSFLKLSFPKVNNLNKRSSIIPTPFVLVPLGTQDEIPQVQNFQRGNQEIEVIQATLVEIFRQPVAGAQVVHHRHHETTQIIGQRQTHK